jgi:hypothetical protein
MFNHVLDKTKHKQIPKAETYQGLLFANPQLHKEKYPA